ncbi:MAG: hypothetical protein WCT05_00660 [Lentisphaeria bacterium]
MAAEIPLQIGSRRELFWDNLLVDTRFGANFYLHEAQCQPLPRSPFTGDYATVIKDGSLYRAYFRRSVPGQSHDGSDGNAAEISCYAESHDGNEWEFPELGLFSVNGSSANNVILAGQAPFSHNFSPFLDLRPGVAAAERYKALAGINSQGRGNYLEGLHSFVSGDGINWRRNSEVSLIAYDPVWVHAFDSQNVAFWSSAEQCYLCYFRTWNTKHGTLRSVSRCSSPDFQHWSQAVPMDPNLPGEHLYTNQTQPYFRAPHIYLALPTRFMHGQVAGQETRDEQGQIMNLGSTDILFMTSRAGSNCYQRLFPEALLRPGLAPERWGNRSNYAALNVLPTGAGEMSLYHAKSGHRYTFRTDGFISIRAGFAVAELQLKPVIFAGERLQLNYSTAAAGIIRVEIQNLSGQAYPGFSLEQCSPLVGDVIDSYVSWENNPSLRVLAGEPVRLRFVMQEADLYSFQFTVAD